MLIQFLRDFQSAATNEVFYEMGTIVDLPDGNLIVNEGAAIPVRAPEPEPEPEPEPKKRGAK
jgi:hypothetical protein